MEWPKNKKFAFTVFDDTDLATYENTKPVYDFLKKCGLRTTKSVWPLSGDSKPTIGGSTCEDKKYLEWILNLQKEGFEIGWHNATFHSSTREKTVYGLEIFKKLFGSYPKVMANHADCKEGIYWGNYRVTGIIEKLYNFMTMYKINGFFRGHIEADSFFLGRPLQGKNKIRQEFYIPRYQYSKMLPTDTIP